MTATGSNSRAAASAVRSRNAPISVLANAMPADGDHMHVPGFEPRRHPARQRLIGRDQRRRLAGRLHRLAQDEGDGFRLVLAVGRLQDRHARQRLVHLALAGSRRRTGASAAWCRPGASPRWSASARAFCAVDGVVPGSGWTCSRAMPSSLEQLGHAELRMLGMGRRDRASSCPHRASGRAPAAPARRSPGRAPPAISSSAAGSAPVTPATITGALGGCACSRATSARSRRLRCSTGEASRCSARCAGQNCVTMLQELERARPMLGEVLGHQLVQPLRADVLRLQRVHQPRQLLGQPRGLRRRGRTRRRIVADVAVARGSAHAPPPPTAAPARSAPGGDPAC